jgi:hypothetical protein
MIQEGSKGNRFRDVSMRMPAFFLLPLSFVLASCMYSFTGASVPPHLKTVAIPLVDRALTDLFISDNSLAVADRSTADALLVGSIGTVSDAPSVVQQGEQVSKRRVTVTARFTFQDMKLRKKVWEKTFSNWGDYDSGGGVSQRKAGLQEAIRKISEDVLLETVSGW